MYTLASYFFNKDVFKARNCVVCREFLGFRYIFIIFFRNKSDEFVYIRISKHLENSRLKPVLRYKLSICICVVRKRKLNGYGEVKNIVLIVRIKYF